MSDRLPSFAPAQLHAAPESVGGWQARHRDLDRRDREVLLCHAAGLTRAQVLAHPERGLDVRVLATLEDWARRRRRGEPVAYILGEKEFWGLPLRVTPAVLIPRPETELLVELAMAAVAGCFRGNPQRTVPLRVLELGTGSGAVAVALAREAAAHGLPVQITASDACAEALEVAEGNARRHGVEAHWLRSDWFTEVSGHYHLIVSNPPYVPDGDPHLDALGHEPRQALTAGADGLDALRAIVAAAPEHLEPGGMLALEHGYDQAAAVRTLLHGTGFINVSTCTDLAGRDRVTRARRPEVGHEP